MAVKIGFSYVVPEFMVVNTLVPLVGLLKYSFVVSWNSSLVLSMETSAVMPVRALVAIALVKSFVIDPVKTFMPVVDGRTWW